MYEDPTRVDWRFWGLIAIAATTGDYKARILKATYCMLGYRNQASRESA